MPKTTTLPKFKQSTQGVVMRRHDLNRILQMLGNITGENGIEIQRDLNGGLRIIGSGSGSMQNFSGTAYVAGIRTTGLNSDASKPWVKCNLSTGGASEQDGPPSFPFPDNEEWFEKAYTSGDIHVVRG